MQLYIGVVDTHVQHKLHRVKNLTQPDFLTPEILDVIKSRDKNKAQNNFKEYKSLRNKVCKLITNSKKRSYEKKIENGKSDPKSIWKIFKEYGASSKKKDKRNTINQINIDGSEITNTKDMANEFYNIFIIIANYLSVPIKEIDDNIIKDFVNSKVPEQVYFNIPFHM